MRRIWAAGAAIVMCLALGGLPVAAQSPAASSGEPPGAVTVTVTGTSSCYMASHTDTDSGYVELYRCSGTLQASDERVSGSAKTDLYQACYPTEGEGDKCIYWASEQIEAAEGTWVGSAVGVDDKNLGQAGSSARTREPAHTRAGP